MNASLIETKLISRSLKRLRHFIASESIGLIESGPKLVNVELTNVKALPRTAIIICNTVTVPVE